MFLSVEKKHDEKKKQGKWLFLTLLAMLGDSGISFAQRMFNATPSTSAAHMDITFSAVMYLMASLLAFAFYSLNTHRGLCSRSSISFNWRVLAYVRPLQWCLVYTRRA